MELSRNKAFSCSTLLTIATEKRFKHFFCLELRARTKLVSILWAKVRSTQDWPNCCCSLFLKAWFWSNVILVHLSHKYTQAAKHAHSQMRHTHKCTTHIHTWIRLHNTWASLGENTYLQPHFLSKTLIREHATLKRLPNFVMLTPKRYPTSPGCEIKSPSQAQIITLLNFRMKDRNRSYKKLA